MKKNAWSKPLKMKKFATCIVDSTILSVVFFVTSYLCIYFQGNSPLSTKEWFTNGSLIVAAVPLSFYIVGYNESPAKLFSWQTTFFYWIAFTLFFAVGVFLWTRVYIYNLFVDDVVSFYPWLLAILFISFFYYWLQKFCSVKINNVVLLGNDNIVGKIIEYIASDAHLGFHIVGWCHQSQANNRLTDFLEKCKSLLAKEKVNTVVFAPEAGLPPQMAAELLQSRFRGVAVFDTLSFYQNLTGRIPVFHTDGNFLIYLAQDSQVNSAMSQKIRRGMDILISVLLLILTGPLLLCAMAAVKLTSPGPIFFRQERVGQFGAPFEIMKLRTMVDNAERCTGPTWACPTDPRFSPIGKFLRKYRLDELPQLFNVLKGEMSIIGPRPERPYFVQSLAQEIPYYNLRLALKPGLTGWAQVHYGYADSVQSQREKLEYDLYYLIHHSFLMDIYILLKTFLMVLRGSGV